MYAYVGPGWDAPPTSEHLVARSRALLDAWLAARERTELTEPFTYVVDLTGVLRLAPRRSEHVACADGEAVLAAGEIGFAVDAAGTRVYEVTNQSTGYCPDVDSWEAVAMALDRLRLPRPRGFTAVIVFRRCPVCDERNVVHEGDFTCALCGARLPPHWNFSVPPW